MDTWEKSGKGLLDHMRPNELADLVAACRSHAMLAVLAGSLSQSSIPRVLELGADYIAVRGRHAPVGTGRVGSMQHACGVWWLFCILGERQPPTGEQD